MLACVVSRVRGLCSLKQRVQRAKEDIDSEKKKAAQAAKKERAAAAVRRMQVGLQHTVVAVAVVVGELTGPYTVC
jgi:hypothetical protein